MKKQLLLVVAIVTILALWMTPVFAAQGQITEVNRDSPDQTSFPGYSSFWDTVKYNPAFQGRQMRPDSLKFPVFI